MEILLGIIGSFFSGGATGLAGMFIQRFFENKEKQHDLDVIKEQNRSMEVVAQMEINRTELQIQGQIEAAQQERWAREVESDNELQAVSYDHDKATVMSDKLLRYVINRSGKWSGRLISFLLGITAVLRKGIRPWLTIYLCVLTSIMYGDYHEILTNNDSLFTVKDIQMVVAHIVDTVTYLTTTCLVWWFGVSQTRKHD